LHRVAEATAPTFKPGKLRFKAIPDALKVAIGAPKISHDTIIFILRERSER
tara:strand:+ start:2333 stop:2485 length:153 start_codon:yes stop_codon:yes gene_type:complete